MKEKKIVNKVTAVGIVGNILLVLFKIYAGIAGSSGAMVSDAVHSLSDVFATAIAFLGVRISGKAADQEHPYGHERLECLASMLLGLILLGTGLGIGYKGVGDIVRFRSAEPVVPSTIALVAAIVSIAVKEGMFRYTMHYAKKLNSSAFKADAWHHRSDALSSVGSLIGIGGSMLGLPIMDPIACVVICACILKVAFDILLDAVRKLLDTSCSAEKENEIREFILSHRGVNAVDMLKTRQFGNQIYVDAEIAVDGSLTLKDAHEVAERVHDEAELRFPEIKHITIHENPA